MSKKQNESEFLGMVNSSMEVFNSMFTPNDDKKSLIIIATEQVGKSSNVTMNACVIGGHVNIVRSISEFIGQENYKDLFLEAIEAHNIKNGICTPLEKTIIDIAEVIKAKYNKNLYGKEKFN